MRRTYPYSLRASSITETASETAAPSSSSAPASSNTASNRSALSQVIAVSRRDPVLVAMPLFGFVYARAAVPSLLRNRFSRSINFRYSPVNSHFWSKRLPRTSCFIIQSRSMSAVKNAPYGTWESPISADLLTLSVG